jgi:uncharacterized alpha-E superfamily protein
MGYRLSLLPSSGQGTGSEWGSVLDASRTRSSFEAVHGDDVRQQTVADYLLFDRRNPSSVTNCLERARSNARAMRIAITTEMWVAINDAWLAWQQVLPTRASGGALREVLEWIRRQGSLFRGTTDGTLMRTDAYEFIGIGTALERADNMARLLDVKYYVLLPGGSMVGGGIDHYQWASILHAASSLRAYHWTYRTDVSPRNIADFLILNPFTPRSMHHCYRTLGDRLNGLARLYGRRHACHEEAGEALAALSDLTIDQIFATGLHEFLDEFIGRTARLHGSIATAYHFAE